MQTATQKSFIRFEWVSELYVILSCVYRMAHFRQNRIKNIV